MFPVTEWPITVCLLYNQNNCLLNKKFQFNLFFQDKKSESSASGKSSLNIPTIRKKSNDDSKTTQGDTDDTKSDVDSEKSRKKKSAKKDKDGEKKKGGKHMLPRFNNNSAFIKTQFSANINDQKHLQKCDSPNSVASCKISVSLQISETPSKNKCSPIFMFFL